MKPLTPEQQAFAEEHHGLLLDFMAKHSLGDDYYDLLANRYLKVVVRYLSEEALRKYSFSTVVWYHLRSELSAFTKAAMIPALIPLSITSCADIKSMCHYARRAGSMISSSALQSKMASVSISDIAFQRCAVLSKNL